MKSRSDAIFTAVVMIGTILVSGCAEQPGITIGEVGMEIVNTVRDGLPLYNTGSYDPYADQMMRQVAASKIGEKVTWRNPETGNAGEMTSIGEFTDPVTMRKCRDIVGVTAVNGQKPKNFEGTTCYDPRVREWYIKAGSNITLPSNAGK